MERRLLSHSQFQEEWAELLKRYGQYGIQDKFSYLVQTLLEQGGAVIKPPHFEKIRSVKRHQIYSMIVKKKHPNIRVIFTIIETHQQEEVETVVLLTAFYEKEKSDYKRAIDRAINRLKELFM